MNGGGKHEKKLNLLKKVARKAARFKIEYALSFIRMLVYRTHRRFYFA